ncbi:MAG: lysostaphin resistance A-like protein [Sphingomonas sp.]
MMDQTPPTRPRSRIARLFVGDDGLRAGWSLVLFFLVVTALSFGMLYLMRVLRPAAMHAAAGATPTGTIFQEALTALLVLAAAAIMSLIERRRFSRYGLRGVGVVPDFLKGLAWGLIMLSVLVGLLWVFGGIAFTGVALHGGAIIGYGAAWLLAFLLVGLFEEFAFRGYLQFTLARGVAGLVRAISPGSRAAPSIGFWVSAIVFSVILFAVAHTTNGGETPMGILAVSLAGITFVFALWWTGSLWWAIGFHTAWDWAQSYLYGVADSGMVSQGRLLATHAVGPTLLSGGATGPEGSILVVPVLAATMLVIWRTMPNRAPPGLDTEVG